MKTRVFLKYFVRACSFRNTHVLKQIFYLCLDINILKQKNLGLLFNWISSLMLSLLILFTVRQWRSWYIFLVSIKLSYLTLTMRNKVRISQLFVPRLQKWKISEILGKIRCLYKIILIIKHPYILCPTLITTINNNGLKTNKHQLY